MRPTKSRQVTAECIMVCIASGILIASISLFIVSPRPLGNVKRWCIRDVASRDDHARQWAVPLHLLERASVDGDFPLHCRNSRLRPALIVDFRSGLTLGEIDVVEARHASRSLLWSFSLGVRHVVRGVMVDCIGGRLVRVVCNPAKAFSVTYAVLLGTVNETGRGR